MFSKIPPSPLRPLSWLNEEYRNSVGGYEVFRRRTVISPKTPKDASSDSDRSQLPREPSYSIGSKKHSGSRADFFECSPCAFYHSVAGCTGGEFCGFCHLCPADGVCFEV